VKVVAYQPLLVALGAQGAEPEIRAEISVLFGLAESLGSPTLRTASYLSAGQALDLIGHPEEALAMFRAALTDADAAGVIMQADVRSWCALAADDRNDAARLLREAIPVAREQLSGLPRTDALVPAAKYACSVGATVEAAQLIGSYQRHIKDHGRHGQPIAARWCDRLLQGLVGTMSAEVLDKELRHGARLSVDDALELAWDIVNRDLNRPTIADDAT
jgi:hypothetical protein